MWLSLFLSAGVLGSADAEAQAAGIDKGLTEQVFIEGGWLSFGTSFADEDVVKEFAPDDPEGDQIDSLKDSLGDDVFGAIAGATGMDKRPSSLSRDGAKTAKHLRVKSFSIDPTAVSNAQFRTFVRDTGYKTEAENFRWSFVLELLASKETVAAVDGKDGLGRIQSAPWWLGVVGATWRKPEGPDSNLKGRASYPAVHISWNDAKAYCEWAGRRLPTEVEWEMAARGGLEDEPFPWGDQDYDLHTKLNSWEGTFPDQNSANDGYVGHAPVDAYEPNALGIYNALGNVWEWCDGELSDKKPIRGGSYVDTIDGSYNHALRVSTRMDQTPDSGSANTGFRCAADAPVRGADEDDGDIDQKRRRRRRNSKSSDL